MNIKMKNIAVVASLVLALVLTPGVSAQETYNLPDPGLTPDSPFYFLDTWAENISLALTGNAEARTRKQIDISQEKLAEAQVMVEEGKAEAVETAVDRYGEMVNAAASGVAQAAQSGEGFADALAELLATTTSISQQVLAGVYERVPEQAKSAIQRAMEVSTRGMEQSVEAVSDNKREQMQEQVDQNLQKARENAPEEAQKYIPLTVPMNNPDSQSGDGKDSQQGGSTPIQIPTGGRP